MPRPETKAHEPPEHPRGSAAGVFQDGTRPLLCRPVRGRGCRDGEQVDVVGVGEGGEGADGLRDVRALRRGPTLCSWRAGPSVAGYDGGFDLVEESLEYLVMKGLDPLTPNRLILPGRAALDGVAKNRRALGRLQLEPVLALQPIRPDYPERTHGTRAVELFPEHQPSVVQAVSLPPGSRSDLRRPDTVEVGDEVGDLLWRRRDNSFVAVPDLHPPLTSPLVGMARLLVPGETSTTVDLRRTVRPRGNRLASGRSLIGSP